MIKINILLIIVNILFISVLINDITLFYYGVRLDWQEVLKEHYSSHHMRKPSVRLGWTNKVGQYHDIEDRRILLTVWDNGMRKSRETEDKKSDFKVALVGCSYTFGQGVKDEETMVYLLNKKYPNVTFDNYGVCGWGPAQILEQIKELAYSRKYDMIVYDILNAAAPRSMYLYLGEGSLEINKWYILNPYVYKNIFGKFKIHFNDDTLIPFEKRLLAADIIKRAYIGRHLQKPFVSASYNPALDWTVNEMEKACFENNTKFLVCCLGGDCRYSIYPYLNIQSPKIDVTHPKQNFPEYRVKNNINYHPNAEVHAYWAKKFSEWFDKQNYLNEKKKNEKG